MSNVLIIGGGDGIGGLTLAFQCAHYVTLSKDNVFVALSCSDQTFEVLDNLFNEQFFIHQLPISVSENHKLLYDTDLWETICKGYDEVYYVCPDLLFRNQHAFPFNDFGVSLATLKSTRLLSYKQFNSKIIYCALNSSTEGYSYENTPKLLEILGNNFKNYTIYVPVLDQWAGKKLNTEQYNKKFPENVIIDKNPGIVEAFNKLANSEICICLDNGPSHISYHLGHNRILLDPRHGWKRETLAWRVRWRETDDDSININSNPYDIVQLIKLNIEIPQTQLIPKSVLINNLYVDWSREMMFKF